MLEGEERLSREELVARLATEPIVVRSDERVARKLGLQAGLTIGLYGGLIVLGALHTIAGMSMLAAVIATSAMVVLFCTVLVLFMGKRSAGIEIRADKVGLSLFRFGESQWSVPWGSFALEKHGLSGTRIVLKNGNSFSVPVFSVSDANEMRKLRRVIDSCSRKSGGPSTVKSAIAILVLLAFGATAMSVGVSGLSKSIETGASQVSSWGYISLCVLGAILVTPGFLGSMLLLMKVGKAIPKTTSLHGPTLSELKYEHGPVLRPIRLERGTKYRYVDPVALRAEHSSAIPLTLILGVLALLWQFVPDRLVSPDAPWIAWAVRVAVFGIAVLPLLLLKRERRVVGVLGDTVWTDGVTLFVMREGRTVALPLESAKVVSKRLGDRPENTFMLSHEVFSDGKSEYWLDRRYLWPEG